MGNSPGPHHIAAFEEVPANGTLRFEVTAGGHSREALLCRNGDSVLAWENSCPHEPDVKLDKGLGALVREGQIVCHKHGAQFNCDDGFCTSGPCSGDELNPIGVERRGDAVYLDDDRFDSCQQLGLF